MTATLSGSVDAPYILWGTPHSLYTGKARSYLIKKGLPFRERCPSDPRYKPQVLPAVGLVTFPVLETPQGRFIQDSTDIVEYLEECHSGRPMLPPSPVQRVIAHMLDGFGLEGMLATAMHYRWSYRAKQEDFLRAEFGRGLYNGPNRAQRAAAGERIMAYMSGALPALGITAAAIPAIERAYEELLEALDIHFQQYPYLLGFHPSIADFGMMAPMFAHLGRDPVPANLMKQRAPNVFRWVERMNLPTMDDGEFADKSADWLHDESIFTSLEPVLSLVFQDWGAMLRADFAQYAQWLASDPARPAGQVLSADGQRRVHATLGTVQTIWRGVTMARASAVHGLWLFHKALAAAKDLQAPERERLDHLLARCGGQYLFEMRLPRSLRREGNVVVLGPMA